MRSKVIRCIRREENVFWSLTQCFAFYFTMFFFCLRRMCCCRRFGYIFKNRQLNTFGWTMCINTVLTGRFFTEGLVRWWCVNWKEWCFQFDSPYSRINLGLILDDERNFWCCSTHTHTHTHRFIQCSPLVNFMYLFSTRSVWPNVCSHYVILLKYKWDDFIRRKSLVGNGIATTIGYNNTRIEAQPMRFSVSQQLWIENYGVNWYLALIIVSRLFFLSSTHLFGL